jgi:hypothetical protein
VADAWTLGLGLSLIAAVALAVAGVVIGTRRRRASGEAIARGVVLGDPQFVLLLTAVFWLLLAGACWQTARQEDLTTMGWLILGFFAALVVLGHVLVVANWRNTVVFSDEGIFIRFMNDTTVPWADYLGHYIASNGIVEIVVHDPDSYRDAWPAWRRALGRFDPTTAVTVSPNTLTVSTPEFLQLLNEHAAAAAQSRSGDGSEADTQAP